MIKNISSYQNQTCIAITTKLFEMLKIFKKTKTLKFCGTIKSLSKTSKHLKSSVCTVFQRRKVQLKNGYLKMNGLQTLCA